MNPIVENSGERTEEFEGVIREFSRRDVTFRRKQRPERTGDGAADQVNSVIGRVAGASFDEIDGVIAALQGMKETLRHEGERVQREIVGYASLSHSATTSMKVIADGLAQWRPEELRAEVG
jgi:hypothetical protein